MATEYRHGPLSGDIHLRVPHDFGIRHIAPLLPAFCARHPDLRLKVTYGPHPPATRRVHTDIRIEITTDRKPGPNAARLVGYHEVVCATPEFWQLWGRPQHPLELAHRPCLCDAAAVPPGMWGFRGSGGAFSVRASGPMTCDSLEAIRLAALAGCGIAILPSYMCWRDLTGHHLTAVLSEYAVTDRALHAVWPRERRTNAKIATLVAFLQNHFSTAPKWADIEHVATVTTEKSEVTLRHKTAATKTAANQA